MKKLHYIMVLFLVCMFALGGCHPQGKAVRKAERQQERLQKQRQAEQAAAYQAARKRHMSLQDKATRTRMKESARMSKQMRLKTRPSLWDRIFRR